MSVIDVPMMMRSLPEGTGDQVLERLWPCPNKYIEDPTGWMRDRLGVHVWSKMEEISNSVRDHRYTAVPACHDSSKSFTAARLVAWWLDVHPLGSAFAVTTAPTDPQVKAILWREIGQAHRAAGLAGRLTLDAQWYMGGEGKELVAYGRKPADYVDPSQAAAAFQGIHATYVLVVIDEACGVPKWLYTAVDSLATNRNARVLAIGNPDDPSSEFEKICRPGSGWNTVHIPFDSTPNFTDEWVPGEVADNLISPEWVEERRKRWGPKSSLFSSKVLARFSEVSDNTLITPRLVREAHERNLPGLGHGRLGCDIARYGDDLTAIYRNRDGVIREHKVTAKLDTMESTGFIAAAIEEFKDESPAIVDSIGVGAGVFDRLREQGYPVHPHDASERANEPGRFVNRRAETHWQMRVLLEDGAIDLDPDDEDLAAELTNLRYKLDSSGRIRIETKEEMKKRGLASPNRADAAIMSAIEPPYIPTRDEPEINKSLTGDLLGRPM